MYGPRAGTSILLVSPLSQYSPVAGVSRLDPVHSQVSLASGLYTTSDVTVQLGKSCLDQKTAGRVVVEVVYVFFLLSCSFDP